MCTTERNGRTTSAVEYGKGAGEKRKGVARIVRGGATSHERRDSFKSFELWQGFMGLGQGRLLRKLGNELREWGDLR